MGVEVFILRDRNLAYQRFYGRTTLEDCVAGLEHARPDGTIPADQKLLSDLRPVQEIDQNFHDVLRTVSRKAALDIEVTPGTEHAVLAPEDLTFGMARMYQQVSSEMLEFEVGVFRSERGALDFLDQPEDTIAGLLATVG
ncbi:hypothetical protein [Salipiger mucosus]|uniref:Uncharacterized protein n=1 Tax=Salipiger mucosus DSM 16094 TaxID=1123237 RepID=S9RK50_9RHOB|nr:hypothetical protein [Salipiger mucosus]EPX78490.1 hypothetical protein Salmuc_03600 [Salipiger mucosus DSM 16094]